MSEKHSQIKKEIIDAWLKETQDELERIKKIESDFDKKTSDLNGFRKEICSCIEYLNRHPKREVMLGNSFKLSHILSFDFQSEEVNFKKQLSDIELNLNKIASDTCNYALKKEFLEKDIELLESTQKLTCPEFQAVITDT